MGKKNEKEARGGDAHDGEHASVREACTDTVGVMHGQIQFGDKGREEYLSTHRPACSLTPMTIQAYVQTRRVVENVKNAILLI